MNDYTVSDLDNDQFMKLPKFLFTDERFKSMSNNAKLAYCLLKDRSELSRKNGWINDNGSIFLYYSKEHVADVLNISEKTTYNLFKELTSANLIREERQGLNKPNKIYVQKIASTVEFKGCEKSTGQELLDLHTSKTEPSKKEIINNCVLPTVTTRNVIPINQVPYIASDELKYFVKIFEYYYEKTNGKPYIAHKPNKLREIDGTLSDVIDTYVSYCNDYEQDIEIEDTLSKMIRLYFNADMKDGNGNKYTHSIPNMLSSGFINRLLKNVGVSMSYEDFNS